MVTPPFKAVVRGICKSCPRYWLYFIVVYTCIYAGGFCRDVCQSDSSESLQEHGLAHRPREPDLAR